MKTVDIKIDVDEILAQIAPSYLLTYLKGISYDILSDFNDYDLKDEIEERGVNLEDEYHQNEESSLMEEYTSHMQEVYDTAIEVHPSLEKIRKYIEDNFRII
jgi:hypothetical protein